MNISRLVLPLLLGISAMPAPAQEQGSAAPDVKNTNSMDYTTQREQILRHMEAASPQQRGKTPEQQPATKEEPHDSTYGQGYGSRKETENKLDRPDPSGPPERPEVIERIERIERPSMGRP